MVLAGIRRGQSLEQLLRAVNLERNDLDTAATAEADVHGDELTVYDVDSPALNPELYALAKGPHFCRDLQWGFEVLLHMWFLNTYTS